MYLRIGSIRRPLNEVKTPSISYKPTYDNQRRMIFLDEVWQITGRLVLQTNATQTRMTQELIKLAADYSQYRPDLVFLEDNGVTESYLKLIASECLDGPTVTDSSFPSDGQDIYATGMLYSVNFSARRVTGNSGGNPILEFRESISNPSGGQIDGFVGGAINYPERQTFRQWEPYTYTQSGSAVGLFGYPTIPGPIWPGALLRAPKTVFNSPRIAGPIPQDFEVSWEYEFGNAFPLYGRPHITV